MPQVIFADCKLFRDIVQSRSLSRAALMNGISQSAASQHVQELEKRLDLTLLDRSVRPLETTPAGKLYFEFCRDVLRREEQFLSDCERLKSSVEGQVRVASIYSVGLSEMTRLREEFTVRFPQAQLHVEYLRPDKIYEAVLADRADLGLVSYPEAGRDLTVLPWREERMSAAMCPTHRLAKAREILPCDLEGENFIAFDEDLSIRRQVDRFLRDNSVAVTVAMQFDNIQTIKEAVELGTGIAILPDCTVQAEIAQGRLVAVPLAEPGLVRPVGIVHRRRKKLNRAAQAFIELLEARELVSA
jgi:DNA-binding transcriptional LysR family regulator